MILPDRFKRCQMILFNNMGLIKNGKGNEKHYSRHIQKKKKKQSSSAADSNIRMGQILYP